MKTGIDFEERDYPADTAEKELLGIIQGLNTDPRVTGIIIQRPMPDHASVRRLQRAIHPFKDVAGMHLSNIGAIVYEVPKIGPCTAAASVHMLRSTGTNLKGLEVTVIGHSAIVGKPHRLHADGGRRDVHGLPSRDAQPRHAFARRRRGLRRRR